MNLVDYSDSEGSDSEALPQQPYKPTSSDATPAKTGFQKVVDRANPHKIRVSLPGSAAAQNRSIDDGDFPEDDRPAKRAKIGSAFSGFNSFLPAPKNPPKTGSGSLDGAGKSSLGSARGGGLGRGISLKTGAAPSFSREAPPPSDSTYDNEDDYGDFGGSSATNAPSAAETQTESVVQEEVKLVGKPNMFKPLSVTRKPAKKKPFGASTISASNDPPAAGLSRDNSTPAPQILEQPKKPPPPPVKKSLFSSYNDETIPIEIPPSEPQEPISEDVVHTPPQGLSQPTSTSAGPPPAASNDLQSLADNLNLTASQRRQLFGRSGVAQDARISSFNLAAEYSSNNALIESEGSAAPVAKVRGIAPGKHSLQQLVNAAASQKEALEESFATGRRNKKDAGGRYGW